MAAAKYSRYYTYIKPVIENKIFKSSAPHILSLITMTIFVIFAIRPTISTILNLQKSIENNKQVLKSLEDKAHNLTVGKNNLQGLGQEKKAKINGALPDNPDITSLIKNLRIASSGQASISALQVQPVTILDKTTSRQKALADLGEVTFSYNVQGTYGQLLTTLYNLQKSSRMIGINSVVLGKQAEGSMVLSITGKAYFLK